jgi:hypothetical protein
MRIVAVTGPGAIDRILRHLGEISAPPAIAGPRAPPSEDEESDLRPPDLLDRVPDAAESASA